MWIEEKRGIGGEEDWSKGYFIFFLYGVSGQIEFRHISPVHFLPLTEVRVPKVASLFLPHVPSLAFTRSQKHLNSHSERSYCLISCKPILITQGSSKNKIHCGKKTSPFQTEHLNFKLFVIFLKYLIIERCFILIFLTLTVWLSRHSWHFCNPAHGYSVHRFQKSLQPRFKKNKTIFLTLNIFLELRYSNCWNVHFVFVKKPLFGYYAQTSN